MPRRPEQAGAGKDERAGASRPARPAPFDAGHESFRAGVRRFVSRELTPRAERWERTGAFPRRAVAACARRGYLALDPPRTAILAEELARCDSMGVALDVLVQAGLVAPLLERLGTDAQRRRWLARVQAGRLIGALAVTEPAAGSDVAALQSTALLRARRRGKDSAELLLNGEKTYVTCAAAADFLIVAARIVEDGRADADPSLILVPARHPGVRVRPLDTLGLQLTAMGGVVLRDCRVGMEAMLGQRGAGYGYILDALDRERLFGGIGAVAWAQRALERTAAYLRTRRAFGRSLSRFQALRHQVADCATSLEAARQLAYAAYARWTSGSPAMRDIAMVKLFSYREAQRAIELCLQLHGGLGYMADNWTSRWYRDARALTIAAGTPEVMRDVIAAHLRL